MTTERASIPAIPTLFRGVKFRSRLEAKWSAFLDGCGWSWQYEPDINLASYLPDFVVNLDRPLLVEVKPALTIEDFAEAKAKIEASGWEHEAVIVGARLFDGWGIDSAIGVFGERHHGPDGELGWLWDTAELFLCLLCQRPSVCPAGGSWQCRTCGGSEGMGHVDQWACQARHLWDFAGNELQWKPRSRG